MTPRSEPPYIVLPRAGFDPTEKEEAEAVRPIEEMAADEQELEKRFNEMERQLKKRLAEFLASAKSPD